MFEIELATEYVWALARDGISAELGEYRGDIVVSVEGSELAFIIGDRVESFIAREIVTYSEDDVSVDYDAISLADFGEFREAILQDLV